MLDNNFHPRRILFGCTGKAGDDRTLPLDFDFCSGVYGFYVPMASSNKLEISPSFADRSDAQGNMARQKAMTRLLEQEDAAYDVGAYREAPPGLRVWCGATVDTADIEALGPWLDWAWEASA